MERVLIALAIVVAAVVVAAVVRRRRGVDAPTQAGYEVPTQLDRSDFPGSGWLVAVFSSDTCSTCGDVIAKAEVLRSSEVDVHVASYQAQRGLHDKYAIDAVPSLVIADADGVVHRGFVGPVTATDLWAAVADAREPGSIDHAGGHCDLHETPRPSPAEVDREG